MAYVNIASRTPSEFKVLLNEQNPRVENPGLTIRERLRRYPVRKFSLSRYHSRFCKPRWLSQSSAAPSNPHPNVSPAVHHQGIPDVKSIRKKTGADRR